MATPLKLIVQRFAVVLLVGAALTILVLDRAEPRLTERLRVAATDLAAPILGFAARPAASIAELSGRIETFFAVYEENRSLRAENARLEEWQAAALALRHENERLRALLHAVPDAPATSVSARVIGDAGGAFVRTLLINAGRRDGVAPGQAVLSGAGLVGQVIEAGERSARVLLLTDLNSRVPVSVEESREQAVASGDNTDRLRLLYLDAAAELERGARLVTSGRGGIFPPGVPVGIVVEAGPEGVLVAPFADWHTLEFVNVIDYQEADEAPIGRRGRLSGVAP